jgi:hypothetical protein
VAVLAVQLEVRELILFLGRLLLLVVVRVHMLMVGVLAALAVVAHKTPLLVVLER